MLTVSYSLAPSSRYSTTTLPILHFTHTPPLLLSYQYHITSHHMALTLTDSHVLYYAESPLQTTLHHTTSHCIIPHHTIPTLPNINSHKLRGSCYYCTKRRTDRAAVPQGATHIPLLHTAHHITSLHHSSLYLPPLLTFIHIHTHVHSTPYRVCLSNRPFSPLHSLNSRITILPHPPSHRRPSILT